MAPQRKLVTFLLGCLLTIGINLSARGDSLVDLGLCRNQNGNFELIRKLICETQPALLEELNPGLKIPQCSSEHQVPKVIPGHTPVSAVFVSCHKGFPGTRTLGTVNSCYEIAANVLTHGKGATVNVMIDQASLQDEAIQNNLQKLLVISKQTKHSLNIIPVNLPPNNYARDSSHFRSAGKETEMTSTPSIPSQSYNEPTQMEVAKACGYKYQSSFAHLAEFDTAYHEILKEPAPSPIQVGRAFNTVLLLNFNQGHINKAAGGNSIALPGGTLAFGKSIKKGADGKEESIRAPLEILDFFKKNQKIQEFMIPEVGVAHIDEIFNIVPDPNNECGFALVRASPTEMVKFLKKQAQSDYFAVDYDGSRSNGNVKEFLANKNFLKKAENQEKEILETASELLNEIDLSLRKKCAAKVVPLPVVWSNSLRSSVYPNPVNGLTVNGTYFFSKAQTEKQISLTKAMLKENPALEKYVQTKLRDVSLNSFSVDTSEFDGGGGNFHCATKNIYLPCQ